ncbi:MAG: hypothetical protein ACXV48_08155 [Halobacteriota archaeon]
MSKEQKDTEGNLIITTDRLSGYRAGREELRPAYTAGEGQNG